MCDLAACAGFYVTSKLFRRDRCHCRPMLIFSRTVLPGYYWLVVLDDSNIVIRQEDDAKAVTPRSWYKRPGDGSNSPPTPKLKLAWSLEGREGGRKEIVPTVTTIQPRNSQKKHSRASHADTRTDKGCTHLCVTRCPCRKPCLKAKHCRRQLSVVSVQHM